ncbi:BQ2448_741 [Microbotryum intermedium]|uniref:BQ2448_741 protein n=1 Tax=Microbotryum intermedium TaxID=269621 RepID=A0A238F385_9BASI|nr:BQ2448_741 [Microbotryum intermedium]
MVAARGASSFRNTAKIWYEPAAIPIYAVVGIACAGAGWYLTHLMRHPDVIWDKRGNPEPWNSVKPDQNTKLYAVNQKFEGGSWKRDRI